MRFDGDSKKDNSGFVASFALDKSSNTVLSEELELFLAWKVLESKQSNSSLKEYYNMDIESLLKAYYPIWAIPFGDRIALIDPVVRKQCEVDIRGGSSVNSFIDQLHGAHSEKSFFRNILNAHQNTFEVVGSSKTKFIPGLLKGVDAAPIVEYVLNSGSKVASDSEKKVCVGEFEFGCVRKEVSDIEEIDRAVTEEIKQLELALSVLDTETSHQMNKIKIEIEGIKVEYNHEIDSMKEILRQSISNLVKRKNTEVEIVASRFSEIKEILISDIRNFKKFHASLNREGGYLAKMANARVGVDQESSGRLIKDLLGDHPNRLKILSDEVSKIQHITKLLEEEESSQLSAIEGLYDELITARSKVVSDLEIDLEIEVGRRLGELDDISERQMFFREKIGSLIESVVSWYDNIDWLVPNTLNIKEAKLLFIPIYVGYYPKQKKDGKFVVCGPGYFSSGLSLVGRAFEVEDRFEPISYKCKLLFESSLPALIFKQNKLEEQIIGFFKDNVSFSSVSPIILEGLKIAHENKWVQTALFNGIKESLSDSGLEKPLQSK